jgi:tetratricopeptide (TPR) repeat protein
MSNQDLNENEVDQLKTTEQEESDNSSPSGMSLFVDKIKRWLNAQNKVMTYGVGGFLVIVIGFICYMTLYKMPREKEATAAVYKVQTLFGIDSFTQVLKDAPKLADKYSGTKAGELATYYAGMAYLYKGDYKNAIKYLEDVDFDDLVMKNQVTGNLGDAYVENKDLESGLKHYLKAAKASKTESTAVMWYKKAGRVYEKKNEWKKALEVYQLIKSDFGEVDEAQDIEKYIARAKAKTGEF